MTSPFITSQTTALRYHGASEYETDRPPVWITSPNTAECWRMAGYHAADPYFLIAVVWAGLSLGSERPTSISRRPGPVFQRAGIWMVRGEFLGGGSDRAVLHGTPRLSRTPLAAMSSQPVPAPPEARPVRGRVLAHHLVGLD